MFRLTREGDLARLTLDRPEARNAIPAEGWRALEGVLGEVEGSGARLLILRGAEGAFCAGADLKDFDTLAADETKRIAFRQDMRAAIERLRSLAMPTVGYVEGACFGAGVALAMACDLRVAGKNARFAITPAKFGISYPHEDVHRLIELVGAARASLILFTARTFGAVEAEAIGLVDLRLPEEGLLPFATAILANDGESIAVLKQSIRLAARGVASDAGMDSRFDELIAGEALALRLEARGRR